LALVQSEVSSHKATSSPESPSNVSPAFKSSLTARFGLIWFSGFRGEDLNVIFYQNMPNLHNRYKSADRKISHKKTENTKLCVTPPFSINFRCQIENQVSAITGSWELLVSDYNR
jgi:hypothetical protein